MNGSDTKLRKAGGGHSLVKASAEEAGAELVLEGRKESSQAGKSREKKIPGK